LALRHSGAVEAEAMEGRKRERTWWWVALALLVIGMMGFGLWTRRAPANSVDATSMAVIERQLIGEGFVLTNSTRIRSEAVLAGVPISRILGTVDESASVPFVRNGTSLTIDYAIKGDRRFNISVHGDATNMARAKKIAVDLAQINPNVSVQLWTNSAAP
jgi:hypothetical protein